MSQHNIHTEQIKAELLPTYLEAAQKVGTVAVRQIAGPGEEFAAYSSSRGIDGVHDTHYQGKRLVMDNFAAVQVSSAEDTSAFYREVENIQAQTESK